MRLKFASICRVVTAEVLARLALDPIQFWPDVRYPWNASLTPSRGHADEMAFAM